MNLPNASTRCSLGLAALLTLALTPAADAAPWQQKGTQAAEAQLAELDDDIPELAPAAFVSGTYSSILNTRVGRDGLIDTGLGLLEIVDGRTGEALDASRIDYTRGPGAAPGFSPAWWVNLEEDLIVTVQIATVPVTKNGDARLENAVRLVAENAGEEAESVSIGVRLLPGETGGARPRIRWAHPFDPATRFALEGDLITRDGMACLWWDGEGAEVSVADEVSSPDDAACELMWTFDVPPGEQRLVDVFTGSPPCNPTVDEAAWRDMAGRFGHRSIQERVTWEADWRTEVENVSVASKRMWNALMASMHTLRLIAEGYNGLRFMTDTPYGFVDVGFDVRAGVVASLSEWGMGAFAIDPVRFMFEQLPAQIVMMTPEQRVGYLHGLTRLVRLTRSPEFDLQLADAIIDHLQPGEVSPWMDPELVREDFASILRRAGRKQAEWPELTWATVEPGTADAEFQAWRRAISAHDGEAAWASAKQLLGRTDGQGIGSVHADGEPDGRFAYLYLHLVREMMVDDHGDDLLLLHAVPERLYPRLGQIDTYAVPTVFGQVRTRAWYIGPKGGNMGFNFSLQNRLGEPARTLWRIPPGRTVKRFQELQGGTAEEIEPGLLNLVCEHPKGVSFVLRMQRVEG